MGKTSQKGIISVEATSSKQVLSPTKCRGRLIHKSIKHLPANIQIIFYQVIKEGQNIVISVANTDSQGNFSFEYPIGKFGSAIAVTSISPKEQLTVILSEEGTFPEFIWLVLENEEINENKDDDCDCHAAPTPFLPDMEDLLADKSYAQDIGGACTNFTTPNRSIEEFNYHMVVRTSDPDLLETDPERIKERIKEIDDKIKRLNEEITGFKPDKKKPDFHKEYVEYSAVINKKGLEDIKSAIQAGQGKG